MEENKLGKNWKISSSLQKQFGMPENSGMMRAANGEIAFLDLILIGELCLYPSRQIM